MTAVRFVAWGAISLVASMLLLALILRVSLAVVGIFMPYLDGDFIRQRMYERIHHRDAMVTDRELERAMAERWRDGGGAPFTLAEILKQAVTRACVRNERKLPNSDYTRGVSRDFGIHSERPWWWRGHAESSTIAVERADGRVRAFRIVGAGWTYIGMGTRIRLSFEAGSYHACGTPESLVFVPQPGTSGAMPFLVRATAT